MVEQELTSEIVNAVEEYRASKAQESTAARPLTADQLPEELKAELHLDCFPEDIQNDILALGQKIADYVVELTGPEEAAPPSYGQRFINCWADTPSRAISQDASRAFTLALRLGQSPRLNPQRLPLAIGIAGATMIGGWAGHMTGCMSNRPPFGGPRR
jgi:hypothetical protein